jgi:hypothetical protein
MWTRLTLGAGGAMAAMLAFVACGNDTGLDNAPRAKFAQLACLDIDGNHRLDAADAAAATELPDFNADGETDDFDRAFLAGVDIPLDPTRDISTCDDDGDGEAPEFLVAHERWSASNVSCEPGEQAVLLVGIGGGLVNLRDDQHAAGVRSIINELQQAYEERGIQTVGVLAGPHITGAADRHAAMEAWLANAVTVYIERFPCIEALLVGHSHGGVTIDVVASRLEAEFAPRFVGVVNVDRVEQLYTGDTTSRPAVVPVLNMFETNDPVLKGAPYNAPNAENFDMSGETAPDDGDAARGELTPVDHTTIDNADAVREVAVIWAMGRSGLTAPE